ncbi:MAG: PQQ-binding-like beta-propeller repeat protein [Planctomycetota bacterium]|nr:PQQ-binding-like beta-propeller repeat protein [Planctomycetota bacterium]
MKIAHAIASWTAIILSLPLVERGVASDWPQAAGPNHDWTITTDDPVPLTWSAEQNQNIRWRVALPETGQSGIAVWGKRLFLTTMKPLSADANLKQGTDIVIYCVDADDGKILWQHDLPGDPRAASIYAYGFSSSSSPTPITDGKHVWFWNASGQMGCWTVDGEEVWTRSWTPTLGRPFNKQYEPIKVGDVLINVEPLDPDDPRRREDAWNYLRGFDARTGRSLWTAREGLTHYNTPVLGVLPDGGRAVLAGRGAHHGTPEFPPGLTMTHVDGPLAGKAVWSWESQPDGKAHVTQSWDKNFAYWLDETRTDLVVLNTNDGSEAKRVSWIRNVVVTSYDKESGSFTRREGVDLSQEDPAVTVFPAWHANLSVYPYVYFQCFNYEGKRNGKMVNIGPRHSIARIDVVKERVEYLELPFQVPAVEGAEASPNGTLYPNMTINSRGIDVAGDKRSRRDGWWWCFNGNTIAVNQYLYFTFMSGQVQVVDGKAVNFDEKALVALNDLGKFGDTWSVNTPSYSNGRLYHRTMKKLLCIERVTGAPQN